MDNNSFMGKDDVGEVSKDNSIKQSWKGLIDDVRIYNCVLDEAEIAGIYLGKFPGPLEN